MIYYFPDSNSQSVSQRSDVVTTPTHHLNGNFALANREYKVHRLSSNIHEKVQTGFWSSELEPKSYLVIPTSEPLSRQESLIKLECCGLPSRSLLEMLMILAHWLLFCCGSLQLAWLKRIPGPTEPFAKFFCPAQAYSSRRIRNWSHNKVAKETSVMASKEM